MNYAQHIAEAELCLVSSALLMESGSKLVAAEAIWGAAVQVINAANHARGVNRHPTNNPRRFYIVEQLQSRYGLADDLSRSLRDIITQLHTHFYHGSLSDSELRESLSDGMDFVNLMIELLSQDTNHDHIQPSQND